MTKNPRPCTRRFGARDRMKTQTLVEHRCGVAETGSKCSGRSHSSFGLGAFGRKSYVASINDSERRPPSPITEDILPATDTSYTLSGQILHVTVVELREVDGVSASRLRQSWICVRSIQNAEGSADTSLASQSQPSTQSEPRVI